MAVDLAAIRAADARIAGRIDRTPLVASRSLGLRTGLPLFLKLENLQKTGSFKVRGAFNRLSRLTATERRKGVVAASAGNHAQGVALAASVLRIGAVIVMPEGASIAKQEATRTYGAKVVISGRDFDEALTEARRIARREGRRFIHAFDDEGVIAGQGTAGLEILAERPDIETIVVPIGGGGLAAGIAVAARGLKPKISLIGITCSVRPTLADGIAVKGLGIKTRPILNRLLDRIVDVEDEAIAEAVLLLLEHKRIIAEGAGAAPLAALLHGKLKLRGPVCLVVSGGNIDSPVLGRVIERGLLRTGRLLRVSVRLLDRPGALARLTRDVGEAGANILHIVHDRLSVHLPINQTRVGLALETRGPAHNREILRRLRSGGHQLSEGWE